MNSTITKNGTIKRELSVSDLQKISDTVAREYAEKQERIRKMKNENRKRYFPKLWAAENPGK